MTKSFLVLSILLLSALFVSGASLFVASTPQIKITLMSQTPDPVEPGEIVTLKFKIENKGAETNSETIVRLVPSYPFKIYGDLVEKNVGQLRAYSTGADAMMVEYKIKVDESASTGDTEIELEVQEGETIIDYKDNEFMIDIGTRDAVLDIVSITSDPEQIAPGETSDLSILVKNLADSPLTDIKFALNFESDDLPLAPYQSSSQKMLARLEPDFQKALSFRIIAKPDAAPGLYKIPLLVKFSDERGVSYNVSDILAVTVGETPKIRTFIKKSTVLQSNSPGTITLGVANAGTTDVKFLELNLLPSEEYDLISPSSYFYIGDVDSDDTQSEEIQIFIHRGVDLLKMPIELKYTDANNNPLQQNFELELPLYSSLKLQKFGLLPSSNTGLYGFILILLGSGYLFYKHHLRKTR